MKAKNELQLWNRLRDKSKNHFCHYCGIEQEDFRNVWGTFRPKSKSDGRRGKHLEIDHKDGDKTNDDQDNLVPACYACNNAKSDVFSYVEFKKFREVKRQINQEKADNKHFTLTKDPNSK